MLYTLKPSLATQPWIRLLGIVGFVILTTIGAQIAIPRQPVPITLQVLMVLMAGLTLGPRDGFLSMAAYVGAIALGFPIASEWRGAAALTGPTAGYIYAFPIAAWVVGILAIRDVVWVRWTASLVAVGVIYAIGATYLKFYLSGIIPDYSWSAAWRDGVQPFILLDMLKAVVAALGGEMARGWWQRQLPR